MKKITFLATALFIVVFFASCSNKTKPHITEPPITEPDGSMEITGVIQSGSFSEECNTILALKYFSGADIDDSEDLDEISAEIARGSCSNGNFSIILPKDVPDSILQPKESGFWGEFSSFYDIELLFSDPNTQSVYINLHACDEDDMLDVLMCIGINSAMVSGGGMVIDAAEYIYIYSDRKCTIKGNNTTNSGEIEYSNMNIDVTLNKGWTKVYSTSKLTIDAFGETYTEITFSDKLSQNYDFKWYFLTDLMFGGIIPDLSPLSIDKKSIVQNFFNKVR